MNARGSLPLLDVAGETDVLAVSCSSCERAGGIPQLTVIEKHAPAHTIPTLLRTWPATAQNSEPQQALCPAEHAA
jgi:hypothetical protein